MKDKRILLLSPEPWGVSFVSKHHYAVELSRGNQVYFMGPPRRGQWLPRLQAIQPGLFLLNRPWLPGVNRLPRLLRYWVHRLLAVAVTLAAGRSFDIIWNFDPYAFQDLSVFGRESLHIYHPVDVHRTLLEVECVRKSDVVFATSDMILARLPKERTPQYQINHGLSKSFLAAASEASTPPPVSARIRVGYVGNLHSQHLDYATLLQIVSANPKIDFHFIGPAGISNLTLEATRQEGLRQLQELPNTIFHGQLSPEAVGRTIQDFDLFLMCYRGEMMPAEMANPHKVLEYLSTGKVIVSNYVDQYKQHQHFIRMVERQEDLPALFKEVILNLDHYNSEEWSRARREFALDNTYQRQIERIDAILATLKKSVPQIAR
ncbi:MAG: glycosyl transferase family 1 [Candidatus Eremiobacteraeota bacterium]|nr:glycosyl transferase family 1 [Candidatus Eremiobacteraeota bacterium]